MKIAVYGQYYESNYDSILSEIRSFAKEKSIEVIFEKNFYQLICAQKPFETATFSTYEDLDASYDAFISIGGDGTILRAATFVRDSGIPILGINAGRLGFLASIPKESVLHYLELVFKKEYTLSNRTVLGLETSINIPELEDISFALNEVSINRKDTTSMIVIETYLDGEYLNSYWADGLIISTPTGSTGYSLSCGGPVLLPESKSLIITPIAPHNLNSRPIVIPQGTEIKLKVSGREEQYLISLDSRIFTISNENELTIKKKPFDINMISFKDNTFLNTLRKKLLWGEDTRN
ncbi:MAG TPA: NAD kinase [Flavobacterium sp.]|nr:NAD kinase [Flavobacterium sp.]